MLNKYNLQKKYVTNKFIIIFKYVFQRYLSENIRLNITHNRRSLEGILILENVFERETRFSKTAFKLYIHSNESL